MSEMGNIEHSTINIQLPMNGRSAGPWVFGVESSMLNVFPVRSGGLP